MKKSLLATALLSAVLLFSFSHHSIAKELTLEQIISEMLSLLKAKDIHYLTNRSDRNIPVLMIKGNTPRESYLPPSASCVTLFACKLGKDCLFSYNGRKGIIRHQDVKRQATKQGGIFWADKSCKTKRRAVKPKPQKQQSPLNNQRHVAITRVKSNDQLNIRQKADHTSSKLGSIPYNAHCVRNHGCQGKWCKVSWQGTTGWVNQHYLKTETQSCR
jgi:hypothetical protein